MVNNNYNYIYLKNLILHPITEKGIKVFKNHTNNKILRIYAKKLNVITYINNFYILYFKKKNKYAHNFFFTFK